MGENTEGMVESTSKLRDYIKGITGFDIMEDEETFKSIYDIIVGIGEKWNELSDIEQAGLLEKLAGKTQANTLASALNNIDTLKEAYNSAEESAGSAMTEQAHFEEGIQYSINQLNASIESLSHTLIDSDLLKFFVDLGTTGVNAIDKLVQKMTAIPAIITGIVGAMSFIKGQNFFTKPVDGTISLFSNANRLTASQNPVGKLGYAKSFVGNVFSGMSTPAEITNANAIINTLQNNGIDFGMYQPTIEELQQVSQQLGIVGDEAAKTAQQMINMGAVSGQAGQVGAKSFKNFGKILEGIGKTALSIGTTMLVSFALNEAFKAYDNYLHKFENSKKSMEEASTSADEKKKDIESLSSQLKEVQDRLVVINSIDGAKLAKDGEKEKLEAQSKELERQIALKEASLRLDARKAYDESNELMKSTVEAHDSIDVAALKAGESRADYVRSRDLHGVSSNAKTRMGIRQAVPAELEYYRALVEERKDLDKQLDSLSKDENGKYSKELADANGDAINDLNTKIETNTKLTDESRESLIEWSNTLSTAADNIKGYEDFGHILTEDDKATIALAESTRSAIDAMADELIAGDKVSESQEKLKNSVVKTSEQLSAQKATVDGLISTYNELYSLATRGDGLDVVLDDEQLKKYGNALEYVNGNYKLNTEKLFELAEAHNKEQIALMKHDKEMANMQYLKNARDIEVYNNMLKDGEKILSDGTSIKKRIADLRNENLAIIEQNKVADYQISQLENVTSAYQKWLAVSGQETDAKAFTGVQDASKSILDLLEKGKIGLDSYKMAVDFVIPEDISSQGEVAIQKYVKNLQKYFTEDRTGVDKFLEKSSYFTRGEKGYELKKGTSVNDIAKDMGWTVEVTRAMIDQLETFGGEFKWDIEGMFSDTDKLVHYQEELAKINEEKDKFNLNDLSEADSERLDELNVQADTLLKKINEVQGAISKTTFDEATETINSNGGIQKLYQTYSWMKDRGMESSEITKYITQNTGLDSEQEIKIYTDEAQRNVEALQEKLQNLKEEYSSGKITKDEYETEFKTTTQELKDQGIMLEMLNEVLLEDAGVSTEETVSQIAGILESINGYVATIAGQNPSDKPGESSGTDKPSKPTVTSYPEVKQEVFQPMPTKTQFANPPEMKLDVDTSAVTQADQQVKTFMGNYDKVSEQKKTNLDSSAIANANSRAQSTSRTLNSLVAKDYIIRVIYKQEGNPPTPPSTGPGGAKGNAFARGNDIVGEQGRELVVDPNKGIWYTVGDSGTEMIDLPKDAIVYSHNQTEALLKSGVTTRGKSKGRSFANGNQQYVFGNIDLRHRQPYYWDDGSVSTVLGTSYGMDELSFAVATLLQGNDVRPLGDGEVTWYLEQLVSRSHDPETIYALDRQGLTDEAGNWLHDLIAYVGTDAAQAEYVASIMHEISDEYERSIGTYARGNAFANGTLVGERGRELVVDPNSGRWYTVGDYGSEMINLPKDAIVYNHQQTEDLLKNGHTGRGHSTGASFLTGNAYSRSNGSDTSSAYVPYAPKTVKSAEQSTKSAEKATKSAEKAAKDAKKATDEAKNNMIWIDRAIEHQERKVSKINELVEDDFQTYTERLSDLGELREELALQNEILSDALERRVEEFDKAFQELVEVFGEDVATDLLHKIEVGSVDKDTYKDEFGEDEAGEKKKKALDKVIDAYDEETKLSDKLRDNEKDIRDAIQKEYEFRLNIIEAEKDQLQFEMDTLEHNLDMKDILGKMVVEGDYQDMIDQSNKIADNIERTIDVLEEQLTTVDEGSAKYNEINSQLISAKKELQDIEKQQAEWNDKIMRLPIERLDKYIGMLENIKKDLQNWISERDTLNIQTLGKTMEEQYSLAQEQVEAYQKKEKMYLDLMKNYEYGSEKFHETADEIQACQDSVSGLIQEMEELNVQFLKLPIDNITKANEKLQEINAAEQRVLDDYDTALSAVLSLFDQQIDDLNEKIDKINDSYDKEIEKLQDELDLLNEQNEAKQMQYNIDKAQYDLDKARQQKNVQVVRNGRIEYDSDYDAIKNAQDSLANAQHDKAVYDLQQKIDALEKKRDAEIEPLEDQIKGYEKNRNRWQTFEDERTFEKESAEALRLFGEGWEEAIKGAYTLDKKGNPLGNDDREYNIFSKGHIELDRQITANEKQIEANDKMIDLMTRYADAFLSGEMTYEEAVAQYTKLYNNYQSDGALTSQEALAAELAFNKADNMASALTGNNAITKEQYDSFLEQLEYSNKYKGIYEGLQKSWTDMAADIKSQLDELKRLAELAEQIAGQRNSKTIGYSHDDDDDGGGGVWSKNPTGYGAGTKYNPNGKGTRYEIGGPSIYGSEGKYFDASDGTFHSYSSGGGGGGGGSVSVKADSVSVETKDTSVKSERTSSPSGPASDPDYTSRGKGPGAYAEGLAKGIIGNISPTEKFKKLQAMGLKPLEPDEVPAFLHVGEGVVNAIQQGNILKSVANAYKSGVASNVAVQPTTSGNAYHFDLSFGDITLPDVRDVDGFARSMKMNFESAMNQQFSKIFKN